MVSVPGGYEGPKSSPYFQNPALLSYFCVFVLFCNVVATSDTGDFNLLNATADCLAWGETRGHPIAHIRLVFQHLVELSQEVFHNDITERMRSDELPLRSQLSCSQPGELGSIVNSLLSGWGDNKETMQSSSDGTTSYPEGSMLSLEAMQLPSYSSFPFFEDESYF